MPKACHDKTKDNLYLVDIWIYVTLQYIKTRGIDARALFWIVYFATAAGVRGGTVASYMRLNLGVDILTASNTRTCQSRRSKGH